MVVKLLGGPHYEVVDTNGKIRCCGKKNNVKKIFGDSIVLFQTWDFTTNDSKGTITYSYNKFNTSKLQYLFDEM